MKIRNPNQWEIEEISWAPPVKEDPWMKSIYLGLVVEKTLKIDGGNWKP